MLVEEIVERIKQIAIQLSDGNIKPKMAESEVLIALIIPRAIDVLFKQDTESLDYLAFTKEHVLVFSAGKAGLPSSIEEGTSEFIHFVDDYNASFMANWARFLECREGEAYDTCPKDVSRFTIRNSQIYYMEKGQVWDGFNGSMIISAVTRPIFGTLASDTFDAPEDFLQKLITYVASIVAEKIPITELGINIPQENEE